MQINVIGASKNFRLGTLVVLLAAALFLPLSTYAAGLDDVVNAITNVTFTVALTPVVFVSYLILALSSFVLGIVGVVFNFAVMNLVFDFGHFFGNTPGMLAAWGVLRDVGNILLLFGFIFMGIQTILDVGHFSVGKALPRLLIFAVLMNFSLFAAEAVIDVSNVFASVVYQQTNTQACALTSTDTDKCRYDTNYGIAGNIVQKSGVGNVFDWQKGQGTGLAEQAAQFFKDPVQATAKYLGLAMLVTTLWVVLLAGAILLIARGVQLALLMVTSPIGFAGMAIPPLEEQARKWWKNLFSQAFFAPVYLILIFVGLKIMESVTLLSQTGDTPQLAAALGAQDIGAMESLLSYGLVIGFMIAALIAAKKFGIAGADAITKTATGFIGNVAGYAAFGSMGQAGRFFIGRPANLASRYVRRSTTLNKIPVVGRTLAGIADAGAKSSFDARGIKGIPSELGAVGKAEQGGRRGVKEARVHAIEEYDKSRGKEDSALYDRYNLEYAPLKKEYDELEKKKQEAQKVGNTALVDDIKSQQAALEKRMEGPRRKMESTFKGAKAGEKTAQATVAQGVQLNTTITEADSKIASINEKMVRDQAQHAERIAELQKAKEDELAKSNTAGAALIDAEMKDRQNAYEATRRASAAEMRAAESKREIAFAERDARATEFEDARESARTLGDQRKKMENEYIDNLRGAARLMKAMGPFAPLDSRAMLDAAAEIRHHQHESEADKIIKRLADLEKKAKSGDDGHGAAPAAKKDDHAH